MRGVGSRGRRLCAAAVAWALLVPAAGCTDPVTVAADDVARVVTATAATGSRALTATDRVFVDGLVAGGRDLAGVVDPARDTFCGTVASVVVAGAGEQVGPAEPLAVGPDRVVTAGFFTAEVAVAAGVDAPDDGVFAREVAGAVAVPSTSGVLGVVARLPDRFGVRDAVRAGARVTRWRADLDLVDAIPALDFSRLLLGVDPAALDDPALRANVAVDVGPGDVVVGWSVDVDVTAITDGATQQVRVEVALGDADAGGLDCPGAGRAGSGAAP